MDATLDLSRWSEMPRGLGYRRWTIIRTGVRQLFALRLFKVLIGVAWAGGVALAAVGFLFSQSVANGGWLEELASYAGPRWEAVSSALAALVLLYPDVCIGGMFTVMFWAHSFVALGLSLIALTAMVPRLITLDRATNALTIYLARPLTTADYLLGKLGIIVAVLVVTWTGPLLFGWLLSVAFAPNADFIRYSFTPLVRALAFNGIGLLALAAIALGVSALGRTSRTTTVIWIGLWLIVGAVAKPPGAPPWLKRASFTRDLSEIRQGVFKLDEALLVAGDTLPITNRSVADNLKRAGDRAKTNDFNSAAASLAAFVALSSVVFLRRLRPE